MWVLAGKDYILRMVGVKRSQEQLQNIPRPNVELGIHVTFKVVQFFSIIGSAAAAGVSAMKV